MACGFQGADCRLATLLGIIGSTLSGGAWLRIHLIARTNVCVEIRLLLFCMLQQFRDLPAGLRGASANARVVPNSLPSFIAKCAQGLVLDILP